mmetsp:Transcript_11107/g.34873  ORF Transcript_11107/g.34873 Transcript_11107/m.34873 type:complete len:242 (-) Transcript_11107:357-1082(-)
MSTSMLLKSLQNWIARIQPQGRTRNTDEVLMLGQEATHPFGNLTPRSLVKVGLRDGVRHALGNASRLCNSHAGLACRKPTSQCLKVKSSEVAAVLLHACLKGPQCRRQSAAEHTPPLLAARAVCPLNTSVGEREQADHDASRITTPSTARAVGIKQQRLKRQILEDHGGCTGDLVKVAHLESLPIAEDVGHCVRAAASAQPHDAAQPRPPHGREHRLVAPTKVHRIRLLRAARTSNNPSAP